MSGIISFNLANTNSGADISKVMVVIGVLLIFYLIFWSIVKIDTKITEWKQKRLK